MEQRNLDQYYLFGDVFETVDACDELETLLGRLKRQRLIDDDEWRETKQNVANIRARLEAHINGSALTPKAPRLG